MLKYINYDIVFQEIPEEVTLAINISNCPLRCKGCHSTYLLEDTGEFLTENVIFKLLDVYKNSVTCICFMGGDSEPEEIQRLCSYVKEKINKNLKTGWYSGKKKLPENFEISKLNYVKLGPYIQYLGGLNSPSTNQRFYCIENKILHDITFRFWNKKLKYL